MEHSGRDIPLGARLGYTAWMVFWVTVVLTNSGPQNFFWLCNMAQFIILYAVWSDHRLLLSSQAGLVCLVGVGWALDFVVALALGGNSLTGFTSYMFSDELTLIARATSLYHVFLPAFVLWVVWRIGYDQKGPWLQCLIGTVGVVGAWLFTEPYRNVNWIHETFGIEQNWMPMPLWIVLLLVLFPLALYFPGHWLLQNVLVRIESRTG